jgi:hypothetical protein
VIEEDIGKIAQKVISENREEILKIIKVSFNLIHEATKEPLDLIFNKASHEGYFVGATSFRMRNFDIET